jgi:magnesium-transporting ATPase (P-type)
MNIALASGTIIAKTPEGIGMKNRGFWRWIGLAGALSAVVYAAHVIVGGILWQGYSHITQTISELTADGAPNASLLRVLTTVYGVLAIIFAAWLIFALRRAGAKRAAIVGAILLFIMEFASLVGYGLFPLRGGTEIDPENMGHLIVTGIVVVCTIGSVLLVGIGLKRTVGFRALGVFSLVCAGVIVVSGGIMPVALASNLPVGGLIERINIFTLQTWVFVISIAMLRNWRAA